MTAVEQKLQLLAEAQLAFSAEEPSERPAHEFLKTHSWLLHLEIHSEAQFPQREELFNFARQRVYKEVVLPSLNRLDFVRRELEPSEGWIWEFIELEPPGASLLNVKGGFGQRLNEALAQVQKWQAYAMTNNQAVAEILPNFRPPAYGRIIIGRSDRLENNQRERWREVRNSFSRLKIRTYAWLLNKIERLDADTIQKLERDGAASDHTQLVQDRDFILALAAAPNEVKFPALAQGQWANLVVFAQVLTKRLARGLAPSRADAIYLESLTRTTRPELLPLATEIRGYLHDLDNNEPNIGIEQAMSLVEQFLKRLRS